MRPNYTSAILAFALGAAIAGGGTATASKLISGQDIKDGSITIKDLSPKVRAKLRATGPAETKGDKGDPGVPGTKGDKGDKGDAGLSLITFADSFISSGTPLSGTDTVVTSTAEQLPNAGGAVGGPITFPGKSKLALNVNVQITTEGTGNYICAVQVSANGGAFYDWKRTDTSSAAELRFTLQEGTYTNNTPVPVQYRIVCNGATTRKVIHAYLTVVGGAQPV